MSPTPVTFNSPTSPASYSWEATDEEVAARYGLDVATIVRFDLNTSPTPPALVAQLLAAGRFEAPLSEYPPTDYRRLLEAAADRYGVTPAELLVGAGADEILDIVAKTFLPAGGRAVVPVPTYAMYRVLTDQRRATVVAVPRLGESNGWAMDREAIRGAARDADVVWLCSPNNPTALAEPDGTIEELLGDLAADAAAAGRQPPIVVLDEAYAEFVGRSLIGLRDRHPNLHRRPHGQQGVRAGRPARGLRDRPTRDDRRPEPVSAAGLDLDGVCQPRHRGPARPDDPGCQSRPRGARATRLGDALRAIGWAVGPSVTNFLLVDFGSAERAGTAAEALLAKGLVPRTFPAGHPLADHLRLTIRDPHENDRLIGAATAEAAARDDETAP